MSNAWKDYQEESAAFFRTLGLDAQTDVRIKGVRTHHDVDVVVRSKHLGFEIVWLVECKHWKTAVSKLHVLALREIVSDVGADRGILLSEAGFQSGAIEAATLTNVRATSLAHMKTSATAEISAVELRDLFDRTQACRDRYWWMSKGERIEKGLRQDVGQDGYSGASVLELLEELLAKAFRSVYPFECDGNVVLAEYGRALRFESQEAALEKLKALVSDLQRRLDGAGAPTADEIKMAYQKSR